MVKNYCHLCGTKLKQTSEESWHCPGCDNKIYANPKPCVEVALFDSENRVLMTKRARDPDKGKLDLPGGFVDLNEDLETALYREVKEELGLNPEDISELTYIGSRLHDYPFGEEVYKNIVVVYKAQLLADIAKVKTDEELESAELRELSTLAVPEVASAEHLRLIRLAYKKHIHG